MSAAIKTLISNKTFCALPFIHEFYSLDGRQYLCCHNSENLNNAVTSKDIGQIRNNILNGIPDARCNVCYDLEKNKAISPRIKETMSLIKNNDIKDSLELAISDPAKDTIISYDIRFDNRCNLACIGCNSRDSSLWARINKNYKRESVDFDIDSFDVINAKKIYLAGGEPLINEKVFQLLSTIAKQDQQPEIVINSNIASIKNRFFEVLSNIKNLSITVSFDGHGSVNEYHRWPLQWDKFLLNLEKLKETKTHISWNTVIDAVSVWGVKDMIKLEHLTQSWNLQVLSKPKSLLLRNMPDKLKLHARYELESLFTSRYASIDPVFKTRINLALSELDTPGNEFLLSNYITQLDTQRKLNHEHYLGVKLT